MRMSDRTQSSVRTGSRGDGDAAGGSTPEGAAPVTSTQAIPGASTPRTQGTGVPVTGSQPAASAAVPPTPPTPPATGGGPVATAPGAAAAAGTPDGSGTGAARGRVRGGKAGGRGPRRARLQLRHVDIWSAFKISFVLSIAMFFIWMVAIGVLYGVLSALGVFETLNDLFGQLGSASGTEVGGDVVTPGLVFGGAAVIGAINIVLMTALCTVGTFIYNLCADLVGGLELTLSERD
jgi:Transmembrane domain of unknown function (DUF3566)